MGPSQGVSDEKGSKSSKVSRLLGRVSHLGRNDQYREIPERRTSWAARPKPIWSPTAPTSHLAVAKPDEWKHLPRRERSLSIKSQNYNLIDLSEMDEDQEQMQSPFFRLPKEVRQMIYAHVFLDRGEIFHVVRRKNQKLAFKRCKCPNDCEGLGWPNECWEVGCRGWKMETGIFGEAGDGGIFPLLQSCRKIYTEAIPILYSKPTFDFDSLESVIAFSCSILPQRFDGICSMQLDLRFHMSHFFNESMPKTDSARWERTWRILASMPKLQSLKVRITWPTAEVERRLENRYLEPLRMLTGLKKFEVSMPWYKESSEVEEETNARRSPLPCKVIRLDTGPGGLARRATVK